MRSRNIYLVWNSDYREDGLAFVTDDVLMALDYWVTERRKAEGARPWIEIRKLDDLRASKTWTDAETEDVARKLGVFERVTGDEGLVIRRCACKNCYKVLREGEGLTGDGHLYCEFCYNRRLTATGAGCHDGPGTYPGVL